MSNSTLTFKFNLHTERQKHGRVELKTGPAPAAPAPVGRVPRVARLMALAISFQKLLETGEVTDMAELARVGHVTRARVTQIMNLTLLAPDIQESILFLPPVEAGHDPVKEWQIRPIVAQMHWKKQRRMWRQLNHEVTERASV